MKNKKSELRLGATLSRWVSLCALATAIPSLAIAAGNTNKGANPNGKPFIELNGAIIEVEGEVSTLQDQVDSLVNDVDDLGLRITANEAAIAALHVTNADLQAQVDANIAQISALQIEVDALEQKNADIQIQINALGDLDGSLQSLIDTNAAMITSLNQSIADLGVTLQDQIDNNALLISIMQDQIDHLTFVDSERMRIENGVCQSGETMVSYNRNTGEFSCARIYVDVDGTASTYPVGYKTVTVGAGRRVNGEIMCEYNFTRRGHAANLEFSQSGGLELINWSRRGDAGYRYSWRNTTNEAQTVNMALECFEGPR